MNSLCAFSNALRTVLKARPRMLLNLPDDIIRHILQKVHQDGSRVREVCRKLCRLTHEETCHQKLSYLDRDQTLLECVQRYLTKLPKLSQLTLTNCCFNALDGLIRLHKDSPVQQVVFMRDYGIAPRFLLTSSLVRLTHVTFVECHEFSHLPILPPGVRLLEMQSCSNLNSISAGLACCRGALTSLSVQQCPLLCATDTQLVQTCIPCMPNLETLVLRDVGVITWPHIGAGQTGCNPLPSKLRHLEMLGICKTWSFTDLLGGCEQLEQLKLAFSELHQDLTASDDSLEHVLALMPALQSLSVKGGCLHLSPDPLIWGARLQSLKLALDLRSPGPAPVSLLPIPNLSWNNLALTTLDLDMGLRSLDMQVLNAACETLAHVNLRMGHLIHWERWSPQNLKRLGLWGCEVIAGSHPPESCRPLGGTLCIPPTVTDLTVAESSLDQLHIPPRVQHVTLVSNMALQTLDWVAGCEPHVAGLQSLTITSCALLTDIEFLARCRPEHLRELHIVNCRSIRGIPHTIEGVQKLTLAHLASADWCTLRIPTSVRDLRLVGPSVANLMCVRRNTTLRRLHVTTTGVLDVSRIGVCRNLQEVRLQCGRLTSWSALAELPSARFIILAGNISTYVASRIQSLLRGTCLYIVRYPYGQPDPPDSNTDMLIQHDGAHLLPPSDG